MLGLVQASVTILMQESLDEEVGAYEYIAIYCFEE